MILLPLLLAITPLINGIVVTVCDCTTNPQRHLLMFQDTNCGVIPKLPTKIAVNYTVYSKSRGAVKIPAAVCSKWNNIKRISKTFFGLQVVVKDREPLETTPEECITMWNTKICNSKPMSIVNGIWTYNEEPADTTKWWDTVINERMNCAVEETSLFQEEEGQPIQTPVGRALPSDNFIMHNHVTIVWNLKTSVHTPDQPKIIQAGLGKLANLSRNTFRLEDSQNQLEYHLTVSGNCKSNDCFWKDSVFTVANMDNIYLKLNPLQEKTTSDKFLETPVKTPVKLTELHLQFIRDDITRHINEVINTIDHIQCDNRKAKHARAISTAQYNGWLEAAHLDLPTCTKLSAIGNTVIAQKCIKQTANFTMVLTKCGPQPFYNNFTININGWELVPFAPCYWTQGFVNFNDFPYRHDGNEWIQIQPEIVLPERDLAHTFNFEDETFIDYTHISNPGYGDLSLDHMSVMADFISVMNEHSSSVSGSISASSVLLTSVQKQEVSTFTTWFDTALYYLAWIVGTICILLVMRFLYVCGIFQCIYDVCCRIQRIPQVPSQQSIRQSGENTNEEHEMQSLRSFRIEYIPTETNE